MLKFIKNIIEEKKHIFDQLEKSSYWDCLEAVGEQMVFSLKNNGKIILAGNGGSAADAQHFAGEIVGRFTLERKSLPALSLCVDPSVLTCIGNDYGYEEIFARQIEGLGTREDIFVGISTSGNSQNIIKAIIAAKEKEIKVVGFLGGDGGKIKDLCDYAVVVPSKETPRIQEIHTLTVHLLCEYIEKGIFGDEDVF